MAATVNGQTKTGYTTRSNNHGNNWEPRPRLAVNHLTADFPLPGGRSGDQFLHHFSRHIGQAEITSVEAVGQPLVIKAHQLEDRRM